MLSVVIPVLGEEPALLDTIAALVPGAADGLVRDVVLAGQADAPFVRTIADAAGCKLALAPGGRAQAVAEGARLARSDWLFVMEPGFAPGGDWMAEIAEFVTGHGGPPRRCAVLTLAAGRGHSLANLGAALRTDLLGGSVPAQGLVVHRAALARPGRPVRLASPMHDRRRR